MKPLIGITSASYVNSKGLTYNRVYAPIARAIADAGGLPIYLPTGLDEATLREIYNRLDAVLLPGGPDINPAHYNQDKHPTTITDDPRDALELPITRWAIEDDRPLFGICRGHQMLNVALGGTLIQDLPSLSKAPVLTHDQPAEAPRNRESHHITIEPDSKLAAILGTTQISVNSLHHQAVDTPSPQLKITAFAPDGVIEAAEIPNKRFALSVQWHPEDLYENDEAMRKLFEAFVEAARVRA